VCVCVFVCICVCVCIVVRALDLLHKIDFVFHLMYH